jgi:predicted component of viral defense system (DUF524 family)
MEYAENTYYFFKANPNRIEDIFSLCVNTRDKKILPQGDETGNRICYLFSSFGENPIAWSD